MDVADSIVAITLTDPDDDSCPRKVQMTKYREGLGQHQMTPVIITAPDSVTHLVSVDMGQMALAGYPLPVGSSAAAFTALPDPEEAPDTDSDEEEDDL